MSEPKNDAAPGAVLSTAGLGGIHSADETPTAAGWYECWSLDDRWDGAMQYRAWGNGLWWTPLRDGWFSGPTGMYRWRGPVADIMGPAPDGTNPTTPNAQIERRACASAPMKGSTPTEGKT